MRLRHPIPVLAVLALTVSAAAILCGVVVGPSLAQASGDKQTPVSPAAQRTRAHAAIAGGQSAITGSFPWLAHIVDYRGNIEGQCTGTVIAPYLVLTAGHCAEDPQTGVERDPRGYAVVTGDVDDTAPDAQVSHVSGVIVYPGYNGAGADAALLVLSPPTTAPAIPLDREEPPTETPVKMVGWGKSSESEQSVPSILRWGNATLPGSELCEEKYGRREYNPDTELCVLDPTGSAGTCEGDSGGPLIEETSGGPVDLGVTRGSGACSTTSPSVYARADVIAPWVDEAASALAPLAQAPGEAPASTATPGVYVTVRSATRRVSFRVTSDGRHVTHLSVEARLSCEHYRSHVLEFGVSSTGAINNGTIREAGQTSPSRSLGVGRVGINLRFVTNGLVEARVSDRVRLRDKRFGLCYAPSIQFWAYRARG